jgi:hypothetical protein
MNHILSFKALFESISAVTTNWYIVSNEASFDKMKGNGYMIFNHEGTLSIIYIKPKDEEEARLDFYFSKDKSNDKKSICECKVISIDGKVRISKKFDDVTINNVWDITALFFDYCDLEKVDKSVRNKFLMGFSKIIKDIFKGETERIPASFKTYFNYTKEWSKKSMNSLEFDKNNYDFFDMIKEFMNFFKKS